MERLTTREDDQYPGSWSRDGETVAIAEKQSDIAFHVSLLDARSGCVTQLLNSKLDCRYPEFSPDGRWIEFTSNESKDFQIYVRPFPGSGMWQVSNEGGIEPLWARNGKQLFYRRQDRVWVVDVQTDGGFKSSKPRLLFEKPGYKSSSPVRFYDLSLDGQGFLMVKFEQRKPTPVTEIILVQNWFEELKRLVPTGK